MLNNLKKFDNYWLLVTLTIILSFGFFLTNSSMGIDDEILDSLGHAYTIIHTGRLGRFFQYCIGYEYIPFFYDFIAILLYTIGITVTADCFMKYINNFSKNQAIVFSCISISFPFAAFLFAFMIITVHIGLAVFFSALATYLFCKNLYSEQKNFSSLFLAFLFLVLSLSLYESIILYFLISVFFVFLVNNTKNLKTILSPFVLVGVSVFSYLTILKICKYLINMNNNRSALFISHDFSSVNSFINSFCSATHEFIIRYIQTINHNFGSFTIALSLLLLTVIVLFLTIKRKDIYTFLIGIAIMLIPLSPFFLFGNAELNYRIFSSFGYVVAITFSILFGFAENNKITKNILTILTVLVVLNQAKEINKIFYTENLKFQEDLTFTRNIIRDLKRENLDNKPVIFAGMKEEVNFKYNYIIEAPEIAISIYNWDKHDIPEAELDVDRAYDFIRHYGYDIEQKTLNKQIFQRTVKQIPNMPPYPQKGYIHNMGDFVIIKIGKSAFDKQLVY